MSGKGGVVMIKIEANPPLIASVKVAFNLFELIAII